MLVLFAGILFWNLGDRLLWGDEAETAVLAVNITKFGVPKAYDGVNYITLMGPGKDTNSDHIWVWSPWLDEYIAAASFLIFGETTFAARFPFAVLGLAAGIFFAYVAHRLFQRNDATLFATLLFITNTSLILHFRQCRYYSVVVLAQIALLYGCYCLYKGRWKPGMMLVVAALAAQWYCNYIIAICNAFALVLCMVAFGKYAKHMLKPLLAALVLFTLLAVPWLLYARQGQQANLIGFKDLDRKIFFYGKYVMPYLVPILLGLFLIRRRSKKSGKPASAILGADAFAQYLFLAPLLVAFASILLVTPGYFYRYFLPLIPVLILCLAYLLSLIPDRRLRYGAMALAFAVFNAYPLVWLIGDITTPYRNALNPVIEYFNQNANPGDSLYVLDPGLPLMFYTDLQIIDGRLVQRLDMKDLPDWMLSKSPGAIGGIRPLELPPQLAPRYEAIVLTVPDSAPGDSRPDPAFHQWKTSTTTTDIVIYKRKS